MCNQLWFGNMTETYHILSSVYMVLKAEANHSKGYKGGECSAKVRELRLQG